MNDYILKTIEKSINKIQILSDIAIHKSRNYMNIKAIKDQIDSYFNNLPVKFTKNKVYKIHY